MVNKEEVFAFLDGLRESGDVNMWGAGPYLVAAFDVKRDESHELLKEWMNTFPRRQESKECQP